MSTQCLALNEFLIKYSSDTDAQRYQEKLHFLLERQEGEGKDRLTDFYHEVIPLIERLIWKNTARDADIDSLQRIYRELEELIAQNSEDGRHDFVVVIPVADRPRHMSSCLDSLLELCRKFNYGGLKDGRYTKVSVLLADDSKDSNNIQQNKLLAETYTNQGLVVDYFGIDEQLGILSRISEDDRKSLINVTGNNDENAFYHKGASITRNIAYLKLNELARDNPDLLFFFVDSDQEFKISIADQNAGRDIYAVNYFYYLNKIFSDNTVSVLTGKVVGDPPVSPSVMAGNFLEDTSSFLNHMS